MMHRVAVLWLAWFLAAAGAPGGETEPPPGSPKPLRGDVSTLRAGDWALYQMNVLWTFGGVMTASPGRILVSVVEAGDNDLVWRVTEHVCPPPAEMTGMISLAPPAENAAPAGDAGAESLPSYIASTRLVRAKRNAPPDPAFLFPVEARRPGVAREQIGPPENVLLALHHLDLDHLVCTLRHYRWKYASAAGDRSAAAGRFRPADGEIKVWTDAAFPFAVVKQVSAVNGSARATPARDGAEEADFRTSAVTTLALRASGGRETPKPFLLLPMTMEEAEEAERLSEARVRERVKSRQAPSE